MNSLLEHSKNGLCLPIDNNTFNKIHRKWTDAEIIHFTTCLASENLPDAIQTVLKESLHFEESGFPGPMCCPFRKSHIPHVKATNYTIMEKSDGLRVLVIAYKAETFPVWRQVDTNRMVTDRVTVTIALERAREGKGDEDNLLTIDSMDFKLSFHEETCTFTLKSATETMTCYRSLEPRLMLYGMDRSTSVYLFDTFFPATNISWFIGDSELLQCLDTNHSACLAFFDMYGALVEENVFVQERSTTARHAKLMKLIDSITASHEDCIRSRELSSLNLYAKELFYVKDLPKLIQRIQFDSQMKKYFTNGPYGKTLNDGLVFTPEIFCCKGGAHPDQLKWKWWDSLTVDWKIHAVNEEGMYTVLLYFKKKLQPFKDDIEGHWRIRKPMKLANPYNLEIPQDPEKAVIVESKFDPEQNIWSILHIRNDKTTANSISTALSVFESVAEHLTLFSLLQALCWPMDTPTQDCIKRLEHNQGHTTTARSMEKREFALFAVRAKVDNGEHKLFLTWCTNNTNKAQKNAIHVPFCEVRECSAIGFPYPQQGFNDVLHHLLMIEVGNAGGTYAWSDYVVETFFDKDIGRWVISRLQKEKKNYMCTFDNILQHLHYVISAPPISQEGKTPLFTLPPITQEHTLLTNKHYGEKVKELGQASRASYREFNNLIKAHQICWVCNVITRNMNEKNLNVIDLCCGRGGDITKWSRHSLSLLFMTDASLECVSEAAARYSTKKGMSLRCLEKKGFKAAFAVHDAFDCKQKNLMKDILKRVRGGYPFHIASCQFSIHYSCSDESNLEYFVSCISASLASGGIFIGTTVSDQCIAKIFKTHGSDFVTNRFEIHFPSASAAALKECDDDLSQLPFGIKYFITVEDSVSNLPEYIVPWEKFRRICERHSLILIYCTTFAEYTVDNEEELIELANSASYFSGKRDKDGNVLLSHIAASDRILSITNDIYVAFSFKKLQ